MNVDLRWTTRRDLPQIAAIETRVYDSAWSEKEFADFLKNRTAVSMSAELKTNQLLVGYLLYSFDSEAYTIVDLAVHPDYQGQGVGSAMIEWLARRLSSYRRKKISLRVHERNLGAQLFLQKCGFQAVSVDRNFFRIDHEHTSEDAYLMEFHHRPATAASRIAAAASSWLGLRHRTR